MRHRLRVALALAVIATAVAATSASAFNLRVPQVILNGTSLQNYLNSMSESINVNTDQVDAQSWSASASGNSVFTLMVEYAGNASGNAIGVYNTDDGAPALFQIFPGAATPGWHALISFSGSSLMVYLFDGANALMSSFSYAGVHPNSFGFYMNGPGGLFYSQDGRNPGLNAQMLTYAGTGLNFGEWWLCFEDTQYALGDKDFDDAVVILESVVPLKTQTATLGAVKALYR
ncbi:MAG TPA: hypothetical protein VFH88_10005 [Candidatus Krumholzibacteria bacterium]|nr:hypothetical protein [Candidatus Krumholzibacteria bacterium]